MWGAIKHALRGCRGTAVMTQHGTMKMHHVWGWGEPLRTKTRVTVYKCDHCGKHFAKGETMLGTYDIPLWMLLEGM